MNNFDWIPWEHDSDERLLLKKNSALETLATRVNMDSHARTVPDGTTMVSQMLGRVDVIDNTELTEAEIRLTMLNFSKEAGVFLDNLLLGFSGTNTENAMRSQNPFGVTVGGNPSSESLYDRATDRLELEASSDFWMFLEGTTNAVKEKVSDKPSARPGVIAHPAFRKKMGRGNTFNDLPVFFSRGAIKSDAPSSDPRGNPLFFTGDMSKLTLGVRSGPETSVRVHDDAWYREAFGDSTFLHDGYTYLDTEQKKNLHNWVMSQYGTSLVKSRIRRAFHVPEDNQFHCIEMV